MLVACGEDCCCRDATGPPRGGATGRRRTGGMGATKAGSERASPQCSCQLWSPPSSSERRGGCADGVPQCKSRVRSMRTPGSRREVRPVVGAREAPLRRPRLWRGWVWWRRRAAVRMEGGAQSPAGVLRESREGATPRWVECWVTPP